jgi:hypothetical protein
MAHGKRRAGVPWLPPRSSRRAVPHGGILARVLGGIGAAPAARLRGRQPPVVSRAAPYPDGPDEPPGPDTGRRPAGTGLGQ